LSGLSRSPAPAMSAQSIADLISSARNQHLSAANTLLQRFEPWLRLLARQQLESRFHAKFDVSDVVQQSMMEAVRAFPQFRGTTPAELASWLRQILAHTLAHEIRRYAGTRKRALDREISLDQTLTESAHNLQNLLAATRASPSQEAVRHEQQLLLAQLLERLPDDYRTVLVLRHLEGLSHEGIARRLDRKPGAVRMLWTRALGRLRQEIQNDSAWA
jgi:RNA polymerase sigma-70 factor, ECF subfamily